MKPSFLIPLFTLLTSSLVAEDYSYPFKHLQELPPKDDITYGDRIRRTMHLLSTSTAERPNKVKILFYGQSITRQNYSRRIIEAKLRAKYPHAQLEVMNTAIGGYQAPKSVLTMHHTLIPHQPDLVVFHVYGGGKDGTYEEILQNIRNQTTAELICVTHHLDNYGPERDAIREAESKIRRDLAKKYNTELVEVRKDWAKYMNQHELTVADLLNDGVHHNAHGGELWGALQARHFEIQPTDPIDWQDIITRIDLRKETEGKLGKVLFDTDAWQQSSNGIKGSKPSATLKIAFEGSRVDVISRKGSGKANIRIDGKRPSEIRETWAATLPSPTPIDYRPAIMRVALGDTPLEEKWTLSVDSANETGREFAYTLRGSISGKQGKGTHRDMFQSNNGIIEIRPEWFTLSDAIRIKKKPLPTPFDVTWKVYPTSLNHWEFAAGEDESNPSGQTTIVQQLPNGEHELEIILQDGELEIEEVLIYRPVGVDE